MVAPRAKTATKKRLSDKSYKRRTKAEMDRLRTAIYNICRDQGPLTVRQLFYRMVVADLIPKTQSQYRNTVCRLCGQMREDGELPWEWIVDETRWMRKPDSYNSITDALEEIHNYYRRDLWAGQDTYLEVWCESASAAGVIWPATSKWDVPLMPAHGFSSKAFCWNAAQAIDQKGKPTQILYVGDYDPAGLKIDRDIEGKLRRYAPDADITFDRIAVTAEQIIEWDLPGRFDGDERKVETEAIEPRRLVGLVESAIVDHIDTESLVAMQAVEEAEKNTLGMFIESINEKNRRHPN